jgi:outer membrane protein assembly factor BamB
MVLAGRSPSAATAQIPLADTVWRFRASANLERLRECSSAELLLTTKSGLIAIDAATGNRLWEHADLPSAGAGLFWGCGAATGISYRKDRIVAFDLVSGQRRWDTQAMPPAREIRGFATLGKPDLLLLFLRTAASDRSLAAMRLSTGERLWQRDDLFLYPPAFKGRDGVSDLSEFQPFYADTDTTLILYVSSDGPVRLDSRTGATLWKGEALAGARLPNLNDYAAMILVDSVLVIPRDKGLVALDLRDGKVLWTAVDLLPARATRLVKVPAGVLVRGGRAYVNVLDPATGGSRWPRPLTVPTDGWAYDITGNTYYVVSRDRLLSMNLETGDTTGLATLGFSDNEHAERLFSPGDGLLIASRQNVFGVDLDGTIRFHRYYHAPGPSFFEVLGGVLPGAAFGSAMLRQHYAYFVTNAPDASGRTGNSLARVSLDDGHEAGRIWFKEKSPVYWPDHARDQVLILLDKRTLAAVRFPAAPAITGNR